jgi:hypothetical protein
MNRLLLDNTTHNHHHDTRNNKDYGAIFRAKVWFMPRLPRCFRVGHHRRHSSAVVPDTGSVVTLSSVASPLLPHTRSNVSTAPLSTFVTSHPFSTSSLLFPSARCLAASSGKDDSVLTGSAKDRWVTKADVWAALAAGSLPDLVQSSKSSSNSSTRPPAAAAVVLPTVLSPTVAVAAPANSTVV